MDCKTLNLRYIIARLLLCITFIGLSVSAFSQKTLSGKVTDESAQPLIGVTVAVQGTTVGTITDIDGKSGIWTLVFDLNAMKWSAEKTSK